jgi:hypothetical protein
VSISLEVTDRNRLPGVTGLNFFNGMALSSADLVELDVIVLG